MGPGRPRNEASAGGERQGRQGGMTSPVGRFAQLTHIVSAWWVLLLAVLIFIDVIGRSAFNAPLTGTSEIIKNSVVSITFLQLPLAIYRGGMIRATVIFGAVPRFWRKVLRGLSGLLGVAFFAGVAWISWQPALEAFAIGEYEGEGALRVPTWPVRFLVVAMSAVSAFVYLYLLVLDWRGAAENADGEIVGP
ncbi:MAG: TRAP transporter small permease [Alphaproteobacteria bacterium]|nr:MAG: TRAP transporter small permease [Alphaproteobacteria bacterium]